MATSLEVWPILGHITGVEGNKKVRRAKILHSCQKGTETLKEGGGEEYKIITMNPQNRSKSSVLDSCLEKEVSGDAPNLKARVAIKHYTVAQHISDNRIGQVLFLASDLCDSIIWAIGCLHALIATDPHSNVSCLDHSYVVGTIPNGKCYGIDVFLDHVYYFRLL